MQIGFEVVGAKSKKDDGEVAPVQEPMRPTKGARNPSTDQLKARRQLAKSARVWGDDSSLAERYIQFGCTSKGEVNAIKAAMRSAGGTDIGTESQGSEPQDMGDDEFGEVSDDIYIVYCTAPAGDDAAFDGFYDRVEAAIEASLGTRVGSLRTTAADSTSCIECGKNLTEAEMAPGWGTLQLCDHCAAERDAKDATDRDAYNRSYPWGDNNPYANDDDAWADYAARGGDPSMRNRASKTASGGSIMDEAGRPCDATTLLRQIGGNRMAIGLRDIVVLPDGIMGRVGTGSTLRKLIVKLNAHDLYDIEVGRMNRKTFEWISEGIYRDVDAAGVGEACYTLFNQAFSKAAAAKAPPLTDEEKAALRAKFLQRYKDLKKKKGSSGDDGPRYTDDSAADEGDAAQDFYTDFAHGGTMNREAQILAALPKASATEQVRLAVELSAIRSQQRTAARDRHAASVGQEMASIHLTPVHGHVYHTAATDWLGDDPLSVTPSAIGIHNQAKAEATVWSRRVHAAVREDREEYLTQARGYAQVWAGQFGMEAHQAVASFMDQAAHIAGFKRQAAGEMLPAYVDPKLGYAYCVDCGRDRPGLEQTVAHNLALGTHCDQCGTLLFDGFGSDAIVASRKTAGPGSPAYQKGYADGMAAVWTGGTASGWDDSMNGNEDYGDGFNAASDERDVVHGPKGNVTRGDGFVAYDDPDDFLNDFLSSRKHADQGTGPSEESQSGFAETQLDAVDVDEAPKDSNLGWIGGTDAASTSFDDQGNPNNQTATAAFVPAYMRQAMRLIASDKPEWLENKINGEDEDDDKGEAKEARRVRAADDGSYWHRANDGKGKPSGPFTEDEKSQMDAPGVGWTKLTPAEEEEYKTARRRVRAASEEESNKNGDADGPNIDGQDAPPWVNDHDDDNAPEDDDDGSDDDGADSKYEQKKDARRHGSRKTALTLRDIEGYLDVIYGGGRVMKSYPDELIDQVLETGDLSLLDVDDPWATTASRRVALDGSGDDSYDPSGPGAEDGHKPAGAAPMVQPGDDGDVAMFEPEFPEPENTAADRTARRRMPPFARSAGWDDDGDDDRGFYNDADIEMAQLSEEPEPGCPSCGANDYVNRIPGKENEVGAVAARNGLSPRDVVICMNCGAVIDNRGSRDNKGQIGTIKVASKVAWRDDDSDQSPITQKLIDLTNEVTEQFGGNDAWNNGISRKAVEDELTRRVAPLLSRVKQNDVEGPGGLEDYNYAVTVRALIRAGWRP